VDTPAQPPLSEGERAALAGTVTLAENLGAETVGLSGDRVAETLLAYAQQRNVSRIVIGKPLHSRWRDRLKGSLLDEIVRGSGGIEVMVIPGGTGDAAPATVVAPRPATSVLPYVVAAAVVVAATLVCALLLRRFDNANLVMVYLLGVAFVATRYGRRPSALAAVLSVAAFDFFFVPPHLTFAVTDTQYVLTFAVMLVVGLLISTLAARVRAQAEASQRREQRTQVLYGVSRDLSAARSSEEVSAAIARHVSELLQGPAEVLVAAPELTTSEDGPAADPRELAVAQWALDHRRPAGLGTDTLPGSAAVYVPLLGSESAFGVLAVRPHEMQLPLAPDQLDLLEALARQAGSALERVRLAGSAEQARVDMETERLRNTLLSSVSHDLRTPLAAITGAASSLLQPVALDPAAERGLKEAIFEEAERLGRLVGNLLDMTRLESGTLRLRREWHVVEELVGSALARLERSRGDRGVQVEIPSDLPLVPVDGVLVEQVLVNLLENAFKYTGADTPVRVTAAAGQGAVVVMEVADEGPGVPEEAREKVFEKFYRAAPTVDRGFGLGLPICRAIVEAHGGHIEVVPREKRGAAFRFTLPLGDHPPPPPEDHDAPQ
ncbi:MAG: DUF4118 domain-containing protein, partial [bacterium]